MAWFLFENLNPEPWKSPEASVVRRGKKYVPLLHKREQVRAYQEALAEEFDRLYHDHQPTAQPVRLELYFWRQVNSYDDDGHHQVGGYADATNLQKSTEDALQGLLYQNDRQVVQVRSTICGQGASVEPRILVGLWNPKPLDDHLFLIINHTRDAQKIAGQAPPVGERGATNVRKFDVEEVF